METLLVYTRLIATRIALTAATSFVAGCGLLKHDYDPCPSDGTGAPVPGPVIEPTSVGSGDNGAGERYRKLANGTVCVCGDYEIGCYETPEGADSSMSCGYDAQGQPECIPVVRPPDPPFHWDNEKGENVATPTKSFTCDYELIDRKTKERIPLTRSQSGETAQAARVQHIKWCDEQTRTSPDYVFSAGDCR